MVSQRVATIMNEIVKNQDFDVARSKTINLTSQERADLQTFIDQGLSSSVSQSISVQQQLAQGEVGVETIDISKQSPEQAGFRVGEEQRTEALQRVGVGRRTEVSEREAGIETRRSAYESLGIQTPGEARREVLGFLSQQSLAPEQAIITQRATGSFITEKGEKIPTSEILFVDIETGYTELATSEEAEMLRKSNNILQTWERKEREPMFAEEFSSIGLEAPKVKQQDYEKIDKTFQPAKESLGEIRMGGKRIYEKAEFKSSEYIRSKTPEWDFKPYEFESGAFEKLDFGGGKTGDFFAGFGATAGTLALSFGKGAYEGFRTKPIKTFGTAAIVTGITFATAGLGTTGALGTYGATAIKYAKPAQYALTGLYGASVVGRLSVAEGGVYGKFEKAGEIAATELAPMALGYKVGGYTGKRAGLYYERTQVLKGESKLLPEGFKFEKTELVKIQKEYKISKALRGVQPEVRELSFKGIERYETLTPKQQKTVMSFLEAKKGKIIISGTAGTRGQLLVKETISPHDIDVFVKGFRQEASASKYLSELGKQLNLKVKGGSIKTATGEKLIEFKPFKEYIAPNIEQVAPFYRTYKAGITKTPEGFKVLRIGYQAQQKILGYARYGPKRTKDIIYYFTAAKPTILKQAQIETVGGKVFDVKNIVDQFSAPKGVTFLGATATTGIKPKWIQIKKGLSPSVRQEVLTHELIHAKHPLWSEAKVTGITGQKEIEALGFKGIKHFAVSEVLYPTYPKASSLGLYPTYKKYPTLKTQPYFPTQKIEKVPYKPSKDLTKGFYPKLIEPPYTPIKAPKQPTSKYKPFEFPLPPVGITIIEPPITTKKKDMFFMGDSGLGITAPKTLLPKRTFQRTPSLGAVLKSDFKIEQPKLSTRLERTGLAERAFIKPKLIKPLGPFKV